MDFMDDAVLDAALKAETDRLLQFATGSATDGGFGWLDDGGKLIDKPLELWINCRMTHVAALGHLLGKPGFDVLVDHGVAALNSTFYDALHGGWYAAATPEGPVDTDKQAYGHAFVILAASSAVAAGRGGGRELLTEALAVHERYFWDDTEGMSRESFDRTFQVSEDYRGVNANMHTVEAYLAAADVTGDNRWLKRAARILDRVVNNFARGNGWRIPEHFDAQWVVRLEYNADQPAHPFRPYGATPGHALEWSRLALSVRDALAARAKNTEESAQDATGSPAGAGDPELDWVVPAARDLALRAIKDGWASPVPGGETYPGPGGDGSPGPEGFVYTTGWDGVPVVRERMHWVLAEALATAVALHRATGDDVWSAWFGTWWRYAQQYLIDIERGSWHHELDPQNRPSAITWVGKPDVYHALQAVLLPRLPLSPTFASALQQGRQS